MKVILFIVLIIGIVNSEPFSLEDIAHNLLTNSYGANQTQFPKRDSQYRIIVFGDFGKVENYFGIGKATDIMNQLSMQHYYEYFITTGDNFYPKGIPYLWFRMLPWISMSQFKKSAIKNTLIYPTLGNHDCYGSVANSIKYSEYDSQWTLEQDYYVMKEKLNDGSSKYFVNLMLNSCKLFCPTNEFEELNSEWKDMHIEPGSEEVSIHYKWLEEQLQIHSSDPNVAWLAISMHHPAFLEQGEKKYLLPLLRKYQVDIMFVGHDHWIEYANMHPTYQVRFPDSRRGPVIDYCSNKKEIINTSSRIQTFSKGERVHQFIAGSGGAFLDDTFIIIFFAS